MIISIYFINVYQNIWILQKIKQAIKKTSHKNYNALQIWKEENPDFTNNEDKQDYFAHTISTIGKPTEEISDKIIKKLCSATRIKDSLFLDSKISE